MDVVGSVNGRGWVVSVSDRSENGLGEARMLWLMDECEGVKAYRSSQASWP